MVGLPRGVEEGGLDVFGLKEGVVLQDLRMRRPCGEQFEQIHDAKPGASDAWPATTFAGFYSDTFQWFHGAQLTLSVRGMPVACRE